MAITSEATRLHPLLAERVAIAAALDDDSPLPPAFLEPAAPWTPPACVSIARTTATAGARSVPVVTYDAHRGEGAPWLVWVHGGGFVGGSVDDGEAHAVCAELAALTGVRAVSVDYRLVSPNLSFPAPLEDVLTAWEWVVRQAGDARIMLGGTSAGANLALAAALQLRDSAAPPPDGLMLVYGLYHAELPAVIEGTEDAVSALPRRLLHLADDIERMNSQYAGHDPPWPSLVHPGDQPLTGLPPTRLVVAEVDSLNGSSERLARDLRAAGVPVTSHLAPGMLHGYLNWFPSPRLPEVVETIDFLAWAFAPATPTRQPPAPTGA
ncbi:alpha/beta hydrolase fold domain-containing protein [Brachybacterium sp. J144]|uniref:alpha/beta hydrolase fold domain-containing protein n=1 Tax=Brachybacterium sp. J144 TaxID=3116487 RepID=UPI002E77F210|nr:alpha/beta hydrolase fold domain-containing protein [Brachybacterium sp. J144]MEE1651028.1 alpha/beta hydrolase fold domain-containing protein [Brachybacterium sp. J144]